MSKRRKAEMRARRKRLRAEGLRPITIWVPDTRSTEFAAEARRQSLAIANSPNEAEDQAFIDALSAEEDQAFIDALSAEEEG